MMQMRLGAAGSRLSMVGGYGDAARGSWKPPFHGDCGKYLVGLGFLIKFAA